MFDWLRRLVRRPHFWNIVFMLVGLGIYMLMQTQLDLLVAPYVWADIHNREVFSLPGVGEIWVMSGRWYNFLLWFSGVGIVVFAIALWLWED